MIPYYDPIYVDKQIPVPYGVEDFIVDDFEDFESDETEEFSDTDGSFEDGNLLPPDLISVSQKIRVDKSGKVVVDLILDISAPEGIQTDIRVSKPGTEWTPVA